MPTIPKSRERARNERIQIKRISETEFRVHNTVKDTIYTCTKSVVGIWRCECPWMTKASHVGSSEGVCKHLTAVIEIVRDCKFVRVGYERFAIVDAEDYDAVRKYRWSELNTRNSLYARRTMRLENGHQKTILLHRFIMELHGLTIQDWEVVPQNGYGLDCRKANLVCNGKPGNATHWKSASSIYRTWRAMIDRCHKPNDVNYPHYGARGIRVCDRWQNFVNFLEDMGEPSYDETLGRVDNDGNYTPKNCRWETAFEQANNRRTNKILTFNGETHTIMEWARKLKVSPSALYKRAEYGWNTERILTTPVREYGT